MLLLQLERSIPTIKIQSRRQALQAGLGQRQQQIKLLQARLSELAVEAEAESDGDGFSSENEEGTEEILTTPNLSTPDNPSPPPTRDNDGQSGGAGDRPEDTRGEQHDQRPNLHPQSSIPSSAPGDPRILRNRHHPPAASLSQSTHPATETTATATGSSVPVPVTVPFPFPFPVPKPTSASAVTRSPSPPSSAAFPSKTRATETALSHERAEQETLTESLLSLATQLKTSSHTFRSSLESEKSILSRVIEGLDRNTTGMEAAGKRMGTLTRMAEGKGWWGRAMMYLWIFGLWIVALVIVFVGPKLRF